VHRKVGHQLAQGQVADQRAGTAIGVAVGIATGEVPHLAISTDSEWPESIAWRRNVRPAHTHRIDGHDVGVVQLRGGLSFVLESLELFGIQSCRERKHFQGYPTPSDNCIAS